MDECASERHTCSAQAECRDLEEGYTCECKDGFIDRSPNLLTQPGRVCGTPGKMFHSKYLLYLEILNAFQTIPLKN